MPAKRATRAAAAKKSPSRAKKSPSRPSQKKPAAEQRHAHDHDHDDHEHVEFALSKKTANAIDRALKGLDEAQQQRVLEAVDRVGEEAGETVGRWVEENVVANVNELLAIVVPDMANGGRWDEARAIFQFLDNLDLPVDQPRLADEVKKAHGAKVAAQFKKELKKAKG